jgi:hypothetical protein
MNVNGGFDGRLNGQFDGGFGGQFDLAVLGYQPQQSNRQLRQEAKQTRHFYRLVLQALLNKLVVLQAL